jgi:hypothetical protein
MNYEIFFEFFHSPSICYFIYLITVGYTTKDVLYRWNSRAVAISDDLRMSQFDLIDVPSSNESLRLGDERHGKQTSEGN